MMEEETTQQPVAPETGESVAPALPAVAAPEEASPQQKTIVEDLVEDLNDRASQRIDSIDSKDARRTRELFKQIVLKPNEDLEKWVKRDDIKKKALLKGLTGAGLLAGGLLAGSTLAVPILMSFGGGMLARATVEAVRAFKGKTRESNVRLALHCASKERLELVGKIEEHIKTLPVNAPEHIKMQTVQDLIDGVKRIDDQILGLSGETEQNQQGIIGSLIGHEKGWKRWEAVASIVGGIAGGYAGNALAALKGVSIDLDEVPAEKIWAAKSKEEVLKAAQNAGQKITENIRHIQNLDTLKEVLTRGMEHSSHLVQQTYHGLRLVFATASEASRADAGQVIHGVGTGAYGAKELASTAILHFTHLTKAMATSVGAIIGWGLTDIYKAGKAKGYDIEYQAVQPTTSSQGTSESETAGTQSFSEELSQLSRELGKFEQLEGMVPLRDEREEIEKQEKQQALSTEQIQEIIKGEKLKEEIGKAETEEKKIILIATEVWKKKGAIEYGDIERRRHDWLEAEAIYKQYFAQKPEGEETPKPVEKTSPAPETIDEKVERLKKLKGDKIKLKVKPVILKSSGAQIGIPEFYEYEHESYQTDVSDKQERAQINRKVNEKKDEYIEDFEITDVAVSARDRTKVVIQVKLFVQP